MLPFPLKFTDHQPSDVVFCFTQAIHCHYYSAPLSSGYFGWMPILDVNMCYMFVFGIVVFFIVLNMSGNFGGQ